MPTTRLAVLIGRFHPAHEGHLAAMRAALAHHDRLLVLPGGANRSRSWKRPFTAAERIGFIQAALGPLAERVLFAPLPDRLYDDAYWCRAVRTAVDAACAQLGGATVTLVGFPKDRTSAYLLWFPEWAAEPCPLLTSPTGAILNATDARRALFLGQGALSDFGPALDPVRAWVRDNPDIAAWIAEEGAATEQSLAALDRGKTGYGYTIAVPTVDAVVLRANSVLMIRRGRAPGKGLWALPGGHIDPYERAELAVVRELREEAGLTLTPDMAFTRSVFDHPERSDRGWLRTEAFGFEWSPTMGNPIGPEDTQEVSALAWLPLDTLDSRECFEDHAEIVAGIAAQRARYAVAA